MAMAVHHHVNRLRWCSTESPASDDDDELLRCPLSPLIFPNNSLISDQIAPADPLFNSNYSPSLSSSPSNYMQQAQLMNGSLLAQEALYDCGDNISLILYCPPWNSCGKVLQFECLPDDDIVNDSLHNLPDVSGLDVRVFNEFIDSIDSCSSTPAPPAANVCPKSDSLTIDLPDLVDRPARIRACNMSTSAVSCSSALVSHGEIKQVISSADGISPPTNQPKKQRSQLSYAGDNCKLAHTTAAALMESAPWADPISPRSNVASPTQAIACSPATPQLPRPPINSTVQASQTSIQDNGDNRESSCKVTLCVKTDTFNLLDGYTWRKYGEKRIKNQNFTRSYFRCAENGCGVMKRTERCSRRQENVLFTYLGRHNHHT